MIEFFQEGGWTMYLIVLLFFIGLPVGLGAAILSKRAVAIAALALAAVIMLVGVGGMMQGRSVTERALDSVPADMADQLRAQGYKESSRNIQLGGPAALIIAVLGVIGFARAK